MESRKFNPGFQRIVSVLCFDRVRGFVWCSRPSTWQKYSLDALRYPINGST
ncbi:hypothetical protein AYI69_g9896, partial [Smittium culicis]